MGSSDEDKFDHPTQKPIALMRRPILNHTRRGELVYDPFLGSGTTLAAAELTERVCCGMEIDPKYVDVIIKRWQQLTGKRCSIKMVAPLMNSLRSGCQTWRCQHASTVPKTHPGPAPDSEIDGRCGDPAPGHCTQDQDSFAQDSPKHYHEELDLGTIDANYQVGKTLYEMATSGDEPSATIFWAKTRKLLREGSSNSQSAATRRRSSWDSNPKGTAMIKLKGPWPGGGLERHSWRRWN